MIWFEELFTCVLWEKTCTEREDMHDASSTHTKFAYMHDLMIDLWCSKCYKNLSGHKTLFRSDYRLFYKQIITISNA